MKKSCFLIIALVVVFFTKPVHADTCFNFSPPESFEAAASLDDIGERLRERVKIAAKECGPEVDVPPITVQELTPSLAVFHSSVKYGWRAGDVAEQSLLYKKSGSTWTYVQPLGERIDDALDLNGDATPELLVSAWRNFRTLSENTRSILAWNDKERKFAARTGFLASTMTDSGDCNNSTERTMDMKIDTSVKTYPIVALTRTTIVRDKACTEKVTLTEQWGYQWDPKTGTYRNRAYKNSRSEKVLFTKDTSGDKVVMTHEASGRRVRLKSTFSLESILYDFSLSDGHLYFKADDNKWQSEYAWHVKSNTLHYRVKNKKTGKILFSKGNAKVVFNKNPWLSSF